MSMSKFSEGLRAAETITSEVLEAVDPTKPREMGLGEIMLTGSTCAAIAILWYRRSTTSVRRAIRWDGDTLVPFEDEVRYRLVDILHYVFGGFLITGTTALTTFYLVPGIKEHLLWEPDGTGVSGLVVAVAGALSMFGVTWSMPYDATQGFRRKKHYGGSGGKKRTYFRTQPSKACHSQSYTVFGHHDQPASLMLPTTAHRHQPSPSTSPTAVTGISATPAFVDDDSHVVTQILRRRATRWKQLAWASACGLLGVGLSPFCRVSFRDFFRASSCTAGVVGSLSLAAMDSLTYVISPPFLSVCGFLVMGASIGLMVLPKSGDPLDAMVHKGCEFAVAVFLCSSFLHNLQTLNMEASFSEKFDPINGAVVLYCHTILCLLPILSSNGDYSMWKRSI